MPNNIFVTFTYLYEVYNTKVYHHCRILAWKLFKYQFKVKSKIGKLVRLIIVLSLEVDLILQDRLKFSHKITSYLVHAEKALSQQLAVP